MRILMVLENTFPEDERVEKEIASLLAEGHEVRIAVYSRKKTSFKEEFNGYTIYRMYMSKLMYKLSAAILVYPGYFMKWRNFLHRIFTEWNFEAIHIHDLPLAKLGYEYKKKKSILFIADQHEYYSNWIVKTAHYNSFIGKFIRLFSNWKKYEKKCLEYADLVCTVEEPLRALYLKEYKLEENRIVVIPNTPGKTLYDIKPAARNSEKYILFYCGGLDVLRGLETPIRSLLILKEKIPGIMISLVGKVNKHFDPLAYAGELGLQNYIEFRGWVHYSKLPAEIDQSDICFFTPPVNRDEINNTIATKIYQYMARKKPVIVGRARYMKEFVEKLDTGIVVDETSPEAFAEAVLSLYNSSDLYERYAMNATRHAEDYYWETTIKPLTDFYEIR